MKYIFIIILIGYAAINASAQILSSVKILNLANQLNDSVPHTIELKEIILTSNSGERYKVISTMDIALRGVNNPQEILRIIPGMVIGQHQGGGKAEQIFLRGVDADHGTDFREDVDGLPINMASHAHGQGYADSHFIIPETIESANFKKGAYAVEKGDYNTTGSVDFITKNKISNNLVKLEGGMFNTYRGLAMFNLLNDHKNENQKSWYVAGEYRYADAYFDNPQQFKRFNLFTKYTGRFSSRSKVTLSATTFWSKWNASGQIPERAVDKDIIGFYGAIDPNEGGLAYRTNLNAQMTTNKANGDVIKNQLYYSNSHFDLHTNFTFFLQDSINGDEIRQKEVRNLFGYNGSYVHNSYVGNIRTTMDFGLNIRTDAASPSKLDHTIDRYTTLNQIKSGNITEFNIAPYISETFHFSKQFSLNAGLRYDQFYFKYNNKLASDTTLTGIGKYKYHAGTLSPKINLDYHFDDHTQFYFSSGKGFHSNDTRVAVIENRKEVLPSTYGSDLGIIFKPVPKVIVNAALWYLSIQQEYTYNGDGGDANFNNKTLRKGVDITLRYQPHSSLYFDMDINYAHGRSIGVKKGDDYIPLAPVITSTGGITYKSSLGLSGSLRYRLIGDRPGNIDNSLTAKGYFITDAVIHYTTKKYEIGVVLSNLLNNKWKETQFDSLTRLKNEPSPVDEICFTPGTPFGFKMSFTAFF